MLNRQKTIAPTEPFVRRHRSLFVSLFVLIPILMIPALLVFTIAKNDIFQQWCTLHAVYENSQGLKKGSQVSMSGTTIGHVMGVELIREGEVHVSFNIHSRYKHLVRTDTRVRLKQRGFVGDWELELAGGSNTSRYVEDNDTLSTEKVPSIDEMIELATSIIDTGMILLSDISAIVSGIEAGEGTIGRILKEDTLYTHINRIAANTVRITSGVEGLIADTRGTMRNVDTLLFTFKDLGDGGAELIDTVMALLNTVNNSMNDINHILKNVTIVSDDLPELMDRLQHDLGEAEMILRTFQNNWLFRWIGGDPPTNPHLADSP